MNVLRELRKFRTKTALAKIRILILLAVMLIVSTYAWFYVDKDVGISNIRGVVTEWDVEYSIDDVVITTEEIVIACDEFYPGMPEFTKKVKTSNKTETGADIKYELKSVKLFGEEKLDELKSNGNVTEAGTTTNVFSTEEYPFNAGFYYDTDVIGGVDPITGQETPNSHAELTVFANWSYERESATKDKDTNDALDTKYGKDAYDFYIDNEGADPEVYPLEIIIEITSAREGTFSE